jgi:REP element-mobilizing transposase RayT
LPSFRKQVIHEVFASVLRDQRRRKYADDFRVLHFSLQHDHVHLIVEADSERAVGRYRPLRSGVSGLEIAFARRLNELVGRSGPVWADRYHRHDLETPQETWNGLAYLFNNASHHGLYTYGDGMIDLHASGWRFDGWATPRIMTPESKELHWRWPVCTPTTWLARIGYRKHGLIPIVTLECPDYHPSDGPPP